MKRFEFFLAALLKIGFFLFILALPLQNRDVFSFFGTRLFPPRLILLVLIIVGLGYGLLRLFNSNSKGPFFKESLFSFWRDPLLRALIILWLIRVLSIRSSLNLKASLSLILFYSSMIALYVLLRTIRYKSPNLLLSFYNLHLVVVSAIGFFGLLQALLSVFGLRLLGVLVGSTFIRVPATFYDANHLPPYLITALPYLLALSFWERRAKPRILLYVLVSLLSLVILLTFSRSGLVAFLIVVLLFLVYIIRRRSWRKLALLLMILSLLLLSIYVSSRTTLSLVKRAVSVFDLRDKSTVAHGILLYGGFAVWQQDPIFGVGYGGFNEAFRATQLGKEHAYFDPATQVRLPIHSLWLETLAETGLIGFTAYVSLMMIVLERLWKTFILARSAKIRLRVFALLVSLLAVLTGGIFYSYNLEFFWFFIFFSYLYCHILLSEGKGELLDEVKEPVERINWTLLGPGLFLLILSVPFLIYNLSYPFISAGSEGVFSVVAKTIRRTGGMGWPLWWVPKFEEDYFWNKPPTLFWLNAFSVFLYDIPTYAVRLWSAIFALLALLLTYVWGAFRYGWRRGLTAALVLLTIPPFLSVSRQAGFGPPAILSAVSVYISFSLARRSPPYFFLLALSLSLSSVINYQATLVLLIILGVLALFDAIYLKNARIYSSFWVLMVPALMLIFNLPWLFFGYRQFGPNFVGEYFSISQDDWFLGILSGLLPLVAWLLSSWISRLTLAPVIWGLVLVSLAQVLLTTQTKQADFIALIQRRLELDRRGTIPLVIVSSKSEEFLYYSEVPILFTEVQELENFFYQERAYYLILDGEDFRKRATDLLARNVAVRVVDAQNSLLLVEKFGIVP